MKFLRTLSIIFLIIIVLLLIAGNIFYSPIRHYINKNILGLELNEEETGRLDEQNNTDYQLKIETDKKVYNKYEKVKLFARITGKKRREIPENSVIRVEFFQDGKRIKNIDGDERISLSYFSGQKAWIGYYFPESPEIEGKVDVSASGFVDSPEAPVTAKNSFVINENNPKYILNKGQVFMGIDSLERISKRNILSIEGKEVDWNYIPEWVNFVSADGIIMLAGITKTFQEDVTLESPWDKDKLGESIILADKVNKRNKNFGIYARGLKVEGVDAKKIGYKPVLFFKGDNYGEDPSFISPLDENRKKSLIKLLSSFMENNNMSYVGFSDVFLSTNYGAELMDNYFSDCQISVPNNWTDMDFNGKFLFFKDKMKDKNNLNRFALWKLYYIADYIRDIIDKVGHKKPIFYYLNDSLLMENPAILSVLLSAGVDFVIVDFNMNYDKILDELNDISKNPMIAHYINRLIVSYYFDYQNLDVNGFDISAIENYVGANLQLVKNGSGSLIANGIVINDLYKLMFGRRGPYTPNEWMLGVGEIVYEFKQLYQAIPLEIQIDVSKIDLQKKEVLISFDIVNTMATKANNFKIEYLPNAGKYIQKNNMIKEIPAGKEINMTVPLQMDTNNTIFLRKKNFLGFRISWEENQGNKSVIRNSFLFFKSINIPQNADENEKGKTTNR